MRGLDVSFDDVCRLDMRGLDVRLDMRGLDVRFDVCRFDVRFDDVCRGKA
jgi:hypothetical protein